MFSLQNLLPEQVLKAISWVLLHSLWQGLIAALLAAVIMGLTRKSTSLLRYQLLTALFILFIATTGVTFVIELTNTTAPETVVTGSTIINNTPVAIAPTDTSWLSYLNNWYNEHTDIIVLTWSLLFFFHCLKLSTGLAGINRLRYYRTHPVSNNWNKILEELVGKLGIRQKVQLLESELMKVPSAIGFLKPVILMPMGLMNHLSAEQMEAVLLHELSHIKRKDYLVNILQRLVEAIFFFNPSLMWISSLIREEREACCDDLVMQHTSDTKSYLEALVSFQEYTLKTPAYALHITDKPYHLLARVKRMLTQENRNLRAIEKTILCAGITVMIGFNMISSRISLEKDSPTPVLKTAEKNYTITPMVNGNYKIPATIDRTKIRQPQPIHDTVPPKKRMVREPLQQLAVRTQFVPVEMGTFELKEDVMKAKSGRAPDKAASPRVSVKFHNIQMVALRDTTRLRSQRIDIVGRGKYNANDKRYTTKVFELREPKIRDENLVNKTALKAEQDVRVVYHRKMQQVMDLKESLKSIGDINVIEADLKNDNPEYEKKIKDAHKQVNKKKGIVEPPPSPKFSARNSTADPVAPDTEMVKHF